MPLGRFRRRSFHYRRARIGQQGRIVVVGPGRGKSETERGITVSGIQLQSLLQMFHRFLEVLDRFVRRLGPLFQDGSAQSIMRIRRQSLLHGNPVGRVLAHRFLHLIQQLESPGGVIGRPVDPLAFGVDIRQRRQQLGCIGKFEQSLFPVPNEAIDVIPVKSGVGQSTVGPSCQSAVGKFLQEFLGQPGLLAKIISLCDLLPRPVLRARPGLAHRAGLVQGLVQRLVQAFVVFFRLLLILK